MLRGAAKNHADVTVVVDPADYPGLLGRAGRQRQAPRASIPRAARGQGLRAHRHLRRAGGRLPRAAQHPIAAEPFPGEPAAGLTRHRGAALRREPAPAGRLLPRPPARRPDSIAGARFAQGKELSFNNIADADTALECVRQFERDGLRHRQARQSLRRRRWRRHRRAPTSAPIAPTRPRPSAASSPSTARWMPTPRSRSSAQQFVEVHRRAGAAARGRRRARRQAQCARAGHRPAARCTRRRARIAQRRRRRAGAGAAMTAGSMPTGLNCVTKRQPTRAGAPRPAVRLARVQVREIQRHRVRARRGHRGRRRRTDEPRVFQPHRRHQGRGRRPAPCAARSMASDAFFPFRDGVDVAAAPGRQGRHPARRHRCATTK